MGNKDGEAKVVSKAGIKVGSKAGIKVGSRVDNRVGVVAGGDDSKKNSLVIKYLIL